MEGAKSKVARFLAIDLARFYPLIGTRRRVIFVSPRRGFHHEKPGAKKAAKPQRSTGRRKAGYLPRTKWHSPGHMRKVSAELHRQTIARKCVYFCNILLCGLRLLRFRRHSNPSRIIARSPHALNHESESLTFRRAIEDARMHDAGRYRSCETRNLVRYPQPGVLAESGPPGGTAAKNSFGPPNYQT